jgi:hypothetical protein
MDVERPSRVTLAIAQNVRARYRSAYVLLGLLVQT